MQKSVIVTDDQKWYTKSLDEIYRELETSEKGLSTEEASNKITKYGINEIPQKKKRSVFVEFLKQFNNPLIYILWIAIAISLFIEHYVDVFVIFAMILANAIIGFIQERKAENAIEALKKMIVSYAKVYRDGELVKVPAEDLVPGDIIFVEEGDKIPADARVFEMKELRTQESALTGESLPKEKNLRILESVTSIIGRKNMIFMGTIVVTGTAKAVVVSTGKKTEIGQVAKAIQEVVQPKSHYNEKIKQLTITVSLLAIAGAIIELVLGFLYDKLPFTQISLFAIASLVSGIPEGLPAALAIILSIGARRMARKKAVVRYLPAIDTLGVTTLIATDKTGTITENSMVVESVLTSGKDISVTGEGWMPIGKFLLGKTPLHPHSDKDLKKTLEICALCNNASLNAKDGDYETVGDPTEVALVVLAKKAGFDKKTVSNSYEIIEDLSFNPEVKFRATLVNAKHEKRKEIYSIGAFEMVLDKCHYLLRSGRKVRLDRGTRDLFLQKAKEMAKQGKRVLAIAETTAPSHLKEISSGFVKDMTLVALVGMQDPPRKGVKEAIQKAQKAGIRVIMKTGDSRETALAIGKEIGMAKKDERVLTEEELEAMSPLEFSESVKNVNIFARVTPKMKLKIVQVLQREGEIVAMTGDGVNDAPALKRADVGVSMGKTGTDVAREASEIVLTNDDFASIVSAIEQGRVIFQNIKKTSFFLVSTGVAEDMSVIASMALSFPLILLPTHFLYLNLVTTGFVSVSFAGEKEEGRVLSQPPRDRTEKIINKELIPYLVMIGVLMTVGTVLMFHFFLPQGLEKARSVAFATMSLFELFQVYNMRSFRKSLVELKPFSNKWVNLGVLASLALMALAFYVPFFAGVLGFVPLSLKEVLTIVAVTFSIIIAAEIYKLVKRKTSD